MKRPREVEEDDHDCDHRSPKLDISVSEDGVGEWVRGPLLGKGCFGCVHKALFPERRLLRFKDFPPVLAVKSAWDSCSIDELIMEEKVYQCVGSSPHIIKCYGHDFTLGGEGGAILNVFLEYASGGCLESLIESNSVGLLESEARSHTRSILRGLKLIHDKGFVHCDVKPANILMVPSTKNYGGMVAKIGDFGLAKLGSCRSSNYDDGGRRLKRSNPSPLSSSVRGTLLYLSPEAVVESVQEQASDIWALGCVVLEMLTGRPPWKEMLTKEELLQKIGRETPLDALPHHGAGFSQTARDFLIKCFTRNPNERPSAEMLLNHPFAMESTIEGLEEMLFMYAAGRNDINPRHDLQEEDITIIDDDDDDDDDDDSSSSSSCSNDSCIELEKEQFQLEVE
ncbi:mitogen-activated protein kinase kinase kinase 20-like [Humulus lupulus]|uniref:mitogen-activated protein kinase kinase kinase 20-like n=1 Tax=Humulus lupulus TaxID=3486 RepID=UPI002B4020CA|nr:mitogen-activated protein kinase kinase kinase 20-like [Humulus lupulus]